MGTEICIPANQKVQPFLQPFLSGSFIAISGWLRGEGFFGYRNLHTHRGVKNILLFFTAFSGYRSTFSPRGNIFCDTLELVTGGIHEIDDA